MRNFLRNIWNKIVAWLYSIPSDKRLHFACGFAIAAFCGLALRMPFCVWPVLFFAFGKEFFDKWTTKIWDWWDFLATMLGGLVPQVFVLLGVWWLGPIGA